MSNTDDADDLPCYREREVAVMPPSIWWCLNDHTGCIWNDGNNTCNHPGESMTPLEVDDEEEAKG